MATVDWAYHQGILSLPALWSEVSLLDKLLYKNRSQHRGSLHFKRLLEVQRLVRLFKELSCDRLVEGIALGSKGAQSGARQRNATEPIVPSRQSLALVLARLVAGCRLVEAIQPAIRKAASHLLAQIAESYFMPFCLAATAALARINALCASWVVNAAKSFNQLVEALPQLPVLPGWEPPPQAPPDWSTEWAEQLPQMLKCDWSDGLVRLRTLSFEGSRTVAEVLEPCKVAAVHGPEGEAVARAGGDDDEDSVLAVYIDRGPRYSSAQVLKMHQPVASVSAPAAPRGPSLPVPAAVRAVSSGGFHMENGGPAGGREERLDGRERQQDSKMEPLLPWAAANDAAAGHPPPPAPAAAALRQADPASEQAEGRGEMEGAQPPGTEEAGPPAQGSGEGPAPSAPPRPLKLSGGGVKLSRKTKGHAKAASTAFVRVAKSSKPFSCPSDVKAVENKAEEETDRRQKGSLSSTLMEDLPVKKRKLMREGHGSRSGDAKGSNKGGRQQGGSAADKAQGPSDGSMDDIFASLLQA